VFALAVSLCEQGSYQWDEFRDHLIAEIATAEKAAGPNAAPASLPSYYENWLTAFEKLLAKKGLFLT
jgi:nitrile hydratase accessory protein